MKMVNSPEREQIASDLEYYMDRKPDREVVDMALEWTIDNPGTSLSEWVSDMEGSGLL